MSGHISLAAPPGCRVESWTSTVLASRPCVCPVGHLQDRRLVLTEPLRTAQRQGGFDGLPWGKKNTRLHVKPFFQGSSRLLREHLQIRRRLHQTSAAHTSGPVPVDRPTLRRHKLSQLDRPSSAVNQSGDSFSSRHKQRCVRCSATHVECGAGVVLLWAHGSIICSPEHPSKSMTWLATARPNMIRKTGHDTTCRTKDRSHLLRRCSNSADIRGLRSSSPLWWNHTTEES